jgi:hypothetical protein
MPAEPVRLPDDVTGALAADKRIMMAIYFARRASSAPRRA